MTTRRWLGTILMVYLCVTMAGCESARAPEGQESVDGTPATPVETPVVETLAAPTGFTVDQIRSADDMPALREAAQAGDPNAMYLLGLQHYAGLYMPRNMAAARKWFGKAHEAGSAAGTNALGVIYYEALGAGPDYTYAMELFVESADAGNAKAMRNIGRMYEGGHGVEADNAEALMWYGKAMAAAGDDVNLKAVLAEMIANVKAADAQP